MLEWWQKKIGRLPLYVSTNKSVLVGRLWNQLGPLDDRSISPALQPNSERFQQGSRTVPVFRGVHFRVTSPRPQRLKPNRFAVGSNLGYTPATYSPFTSLLDGSKLQEPKRPPQNDPTLKLMNIGEWLYIKPGCPG